MVMSVAESNLVFIIVYTRRIFSYTMKLVENLEHLSRVRAHWRLIYAFY